MAGESARLIRSNGATVALLAEGDALALALRDTAARLAAQLETYMPGLDDVALSRSLLQAKRDVFNLRAVRPADLGRIASLISADLLQALRAFDQEIARLQQCRTGLEAAYQGELLDSEADLRQLCQRSNLGKGISYSHPELYAELERLFISGDHHYDSKKRRNLEDTLMQYALRCVTKISPLSSFTTVYFGPWAQDSKAAFDVAFAGDTLSLVELKSALSRQLLEPLLKNYALVRNSMPLALNPTIEALDGVLSWRTVAAGSLLTGRTWGTAESQVQSKDNAVIRCIRHVYSQAGATTLSVNDLLAAVCKLAPKLTAEQAEGVVRQLFDVGALLPYTGLHEQMDPLDAITSVVGQLGGPLAAACQAPLCAIAALLAEFGSAPAAQRGELVNGMRNAVDALAAAIGCELNPKIAQSTFFENCYLKAPSRALSQAALAPFHDDLALLLEMSPLLDFNQRVLSDMADCFVAQFGVDGRCDDIEAFVRHFESHYRPGTFFSTEQPKEKAPRSPETRAQLKAGNAFIALVANGLRSGSDVVLEPAAIRHILDTLPQSVRLRSVSHSFLGQICQHDGHSPKLVVNQILGGRASMMSRFLESVSDEECAGVRRYLKASSQHGRYAALAGVFGFNANRHPQLADEELDIGAFGPAWQGSRKLALSSLRLRYDAAHHGMRFEDADGQPLDIWYQGFLIPSLLPPVHRALALALTDGHINFSFSALVDGGVAAGDRVTVLPRVSLGKLVLMRRTHVFPTPFLLDPSLKPFEFFMAFQAWWQAHGLSRSFYVRLLPLDTDPAANPAWWNLNPKDMKPFYVRYDNPRLVRLLQRAMKKNRLPLFITEALPDIDDQHVTVADEPRVAEIHFELSHPGYRSTKPANAPLPTNELVEA